MLINALNVFVSVAYSNLGLIKGVQPAKLEAGQISLGTWWSRVEHRHEQVGDFTKGTKAKKDLVAKNWADDNIQIVPTYKMTSYEKSWLNNLLDIFCIQLDHNASILPDGASITAQTYYKRYHLSGKIIYRMINKRCSSSNKSYFQKIKKHFLQCKLSCEMLIVLCVTQIIGGGGDSGACG